ncbi:hypothetical protein ABW19_dt0207497 [Dactylella cylindrospora]|nr:hypothetical protein ABW19_dt0207497 [Dactylella cylindrospora]
MSSESEPKPFVRPINPSTDAESTFVVVCWLKLQPISPCSGGTSKTLLTCYSQCQKTVGVDLREGVPNLIAPYIWSVPYVRYSSDHCFVVDDGTGVAVGYIICAPDTPAFVKRFRNEYLPIVESLDPILKKPVMEPPADWSVDLTLGLLQCLHSPEEMLHPVDLRLVEEYPAHLHIDILPDYQRKGFGKQLMETLWEKLRGEGVPGVHLVMDWRNVDAEKFYMAIGFKRFDAVVDGGKSGQIGKETNGNLWMVKNLT